MTEVGQIVPLIVGPVYGNDCYSLIEGRRRLTAAEFIEANGTAFPLACVVRYGSAKEARRIAIHANIKRRGLTALQFAHLCADLRKEHNWEGTLELSKYLQVSRAKISEHDKLLRKPDAMDQQTYERLLALVQAGRMGASTAFYALTHVEPDAVSGILERAQELAQERVQSSETVKQDTDTPETQPTSPRSANARGEASGARYAPSKPAGRAKKTKTTDVKLERKHLSRAARESGSVKAATQRTLPELQTLLQKLREPDYPDVMRSFISILADSWWRGSVADADVIAAWQLIESYVRTLRPIHGGALRLR
jgi:ParB-like chromosome segregation protein Spo0J